MYTAQEYRKDHIIVKYKSSFNAEKIHTFSDSKKMTLVRTLGKTGMTLMKIPIGKTIEGTIRELKVDPNIEYAEPDYVLHIIATPNDSSFSSLWGMHSTQNADADIDATTAWDKATDSSVIVAVIDTGVDYNHPDLKDNIWKNTGEIPNNNTDDDGNGFVDDVFGWDSINNDGDPFDDHSHGTHCAGTIGARGDNGIGVAGVCWKARIMSLKFLSAYGSGYTSDAVVCIDYALEMGAKVISASWGGTGSSQALKDAIERANSQGLLFIAAAGNSRWNNDERPFYPASYDCENIISVAATDEDANLASFSCYGKVSVDLAAPGVNILSTVPNSSYRYYSGTSMATPHVAGSITLMMSYYPQTSHSIIKERLLSSVDPFDELKEKVASGGKLNLFKCLGFSRDIPLPDEPPIAPGPDERDAVEVWNNLVDLSKNPEVRIMIKSDSNNFDAVILNMNGKCIKELRPGSRWNSTTYEYKWNCKDSRSKIVNPGVYLFVLKSDNKRIIKRVFIKE